MADETKANAERAADRRESGGDAAVGDAAGAAAATRTGRGRRRRRRAARPAPPPRPPAAPIPDLAGKTTNAASPGGAAAARPRPPSRRRRRRRRDPDDTSPLLTRRAWMGLAWGAFSAASAAALAATGRFMFPNVLNEPPQQFKAGFPNEYGMGVDERWKEKFGVWLVRTPDDIDAARQRLLRADHAPARTSAARRTTCRRRTSSSARATAAASASTGINFEGPAPRPLERARIVLADDGQILVDKSRHFQHELGQWTDPEAFLKA